MMQTIGAIAFVGCILGGFVCWGVAVYNMFRSVALRKPGVSLWHGTLLNPFNLLLQPDKLTNAVVIARRRCFYGVVGFFACWLLGAVVHVAFGLEGPDLADLGTQHVLNKGGGAVRNPADVLDCFQRDILSTRRA